MDAGLEKLEELRQKKLKAIENWESDVEILSAHISDFKNQLLGIEEAIKILTRQGTSAFSGGSQALIAKYANQNLTPAVLDVLKTSESTTGLLVPEIIDQLKSDGFSSEAKNLYASVYAVGLRLVKQGKAKEGKRTGKRTFMKA